MPEQRLEEGEALAMGMAGRRAVWAEDVTSAKP